MAREESTREDLLREATALVERIELVPNSPASSSAGDTRGHAHIVAGFRADGALSIFFGEDPVYQFNAAGELRRAYFDGKLVKAVRGRLVSLQRVRAEQEVQLLSHELSDVDQAAFLARMADYVQKLNLLLNAGGFDVVGQVPPNGNVLDRLRDWLSARSEIAIASRPNA